MKSRLACCSAVEAALKEFLSMYFHRKLKVEFDSALDEMELRSLLAICVSLHLLKEEDELIKQIRKVEQIRHGFVHSKVRRIMQEARERLAKEGGRAWEEALDEVVKDFLAAASAGENKSPAMLELLEQILRGLFQDSDFSKW